MGKPLAIAGNGGRGLGEEEAAQKGGPWRSLTGTGGELMVAQMKAARVEYLFTNPGSFEVGFFDALVDDKQLKLIEALHEGIVLSMADGYAKVALRPALVNVHTIGGTAQMGGQLYNASRDGSPIVITAGLNPNNDWSDDVLLGPRPNFDQREVPREFTKLSWEVRDGRAIPLMVRRAFKVATAEPPGPVYLAASYRALEERNVTAEVYPLERFQLASEAYPDKAAVELLAAKLLTAKHPLIVVGDEAWRAGAQSLVVELAEKVGAPVASEAEQYVYVSFPSHHRLALGIERGPLFQRADLLLFVGAADAGDKQIPSAPELPGDAWIARMGMNTEAMGRTYATDLALVCHVKHGLIDLLATLDGAETTERLRAIADMRKAELIPAIEARRASRARALAAMMRQSSPPGRITAAELGEAMARVLDQNAIIVDESLSGIYDAFNFGFRDGERMYLGTSGASLGWGVGAATGAKLAAPDRQVVCSIGDGALMYSSSGFWTQARHGIPVLTVVWNNRNYQTVRLAFFDYKGRMAKENKYAGMDLGSPEIDFVQLAGSQGVKGERVERLLELDAALDRGQAVVRAGRPYLVEVVIAKYGGGADSTWHEAYGFSSDRQPTGVTVPSLASPNVIP